MEPKEKPTITGLYDETQGAAPSGEEAVNPVEPGPSTAEDGNSAGVKSFSAADVLDWVLTARGSLIAADVLDEKRCAMWLTALLFGGEYNVFKCPHCNEYVNAAQAFRFITGARFFCKACVSSSTAKTGTFLQGTHMEFRQVFLLAVLIDLMETGITPGRIAEMVGISADTVRLWIKKFKAFEEHGR